MSRTEVTDIGGGEGVGDATQSPPLSVPLPVLEVDPLETAQAIHSASKAHIRVLKARTEEAKRRLVVYSIGPNFSF